MPSRHGRRQRALLWWILLAVVFICGALIPAFEAFLDVIVTIIVVGVGGIWLIIRLVGLGWDTLESQSENRRPVPSWARVGLRPLTKLVDAPPTPPPGWDTVSPPGETGAGETGTPVGRLVDETGTAPGGTAPLPATPAAGRDGGTVG
jgi:hypothetical protein